MNVLRSVGWVLVGGAVSVGATALLGFVLWMALSLAGEKVPFAVMDVLIVWMTALPIAFGIGAVLSLYARLSSRWQPDPLPWRLLQFAVPVASLVLAGVQVAFLV